MTDDSTFAAVLRPGDRCLITIADRDVSVDQGEVMRAQLSDRFPGVEFTFMSGVTGLAVQRAEPCECGPNTMCVPHAMGQEETS